MMLITPEYIKLNKELHARQYNYGITGSERRDYVRPLSDWGRKAILDYGAGKCQLAKSLGPAYKVTNYDPCVDGLEANPEPHPVVVCSDVLEHVEPECLDAVLEDLYRVTIGVGFFLMGLEPSTKSLSDGRNAHLIIEPPHWWRNRLEMAGFEIMEMKSLERTKVNTWFVVRRRAVQ